MDKTFLNFLQNSGMDKIFLTILQNGGMDKSMVKDRKKILISIIIPVYNVKKYLHKCVKSVALQGNFDGAYEIILVDDGSSDGSGQICDDFEREYPFIHVRHQENAGLGAARNAGIRAAVGEYLLFLDADDFIGRNSLAGILAEIQRNCADVYFLNSFKYFGRNRLQVMNDSRLKEVNFLAKNDCMRLFAGLGRYPGSACDKLVQRRMLEKHRIYFEEGVVSEDLVWVLKCLLYADTYRYIDVDYYYYRQNRSGSITSRRDAARFADQIQAIRQGMALAETPEGIGYRKEIHSMMAYEVEVALLFLGMMRRKTKWQVRMAEEVVWLLDVRKVRRTKWIWRVVQCIGIEKTAGLLKWGYWIKTKMAEREPGYVHGFQVLRPGYKRSGL